MQLGILVTDHGKHSAEKWAAHTAGHIIQIATTAAGAQAIEGRKLELQIIEILEKHHSDVMAHEQKCLAEDGVDRHDEPHEPEAFADGGLADIVAAAAGTQFESHFADPETVLHIAKVLHEHFAASMDIERQWHPTHKAHCERKAQRAAQAEKADKAREHK